MNLVNFRVIEFNNNHKIKVENVQRDSIFQTGNQTRDMTKKRISVLISSNPLEEMKVQFKRESIIGSENINKKINQIIKNEQTNLDKIIFEEKEEIENIDSKEKCIINLKTNIVIDELFYKYFNTENNIIYFSENKNINFSIKLNQKEIESLNQMKHLISNK